MIRHARLTFTLVAALPVAALAGPLTPPSGPISATSKQIAEIEPRIAINSTNTPGDADSTFHISGSGSYYLTGNITGEATKRGIEIIASAGQQVTIDLNGFTMTGTAGTSTQPAIFIDGVNAHVAVRNGAIRSWKTAVQHFTGGSVTLKDIHAYQSTGIQFDLRNATCVRCFADDGSNSGFFVDGGVLVDCFARSNSGNGFTINSAALIATGCAAIGNTGIGFSLGSGIATACRSESNGTGFQNPGVLTDCTAVSSTGDGVTASLASVIRGCFVSASGGDGIQVSSSSRVEGNTVTGSTAHGINCIGVRTTIINNSISSNARGTGAFAGVFASGSDNTIDSNHITNMIVGADDFGIQVTGTSNLVVRNVISGVTTAMSIAAGNTSGGASATPATAGAWANITY